MAQQIGLEAIFELGKFTPRINKYISDLDKASKDTDKAAGGMGKAWGQLGSSVTKTTAVLGGAVVVAAGLAGAAIGGFVAGGISKAADLEKQMSGIAATLNLTKQEAQPLKDLISNLALDPTLVVNTGEAAQAIENLAKNGLSMQQILDGAAKSTVLLANATGADFGMAADIATDAMAIFNIEAKNMNDAVDGIVSVTNASKFGIQDYALALSQGGAVAQSAGVSFDDFNASITAISPAFASGSDAGTSFKTFIASLTPNSKKAAEAMKSLGLEFYDASGQMKSMSDIATELNDALFQEVAFTSVVNGATKEQIATKKMLESQIAKTNMELYKYEVGLNGVAQSEEDKVVSIDRLNRQHDAAITAYQNLAISQGTTITTTRKLTEEERALAVETIFGSDASRAAIGLAESGAVVYTDMAVAMKETGLSQEALNEAMKDGSITQFELNQAMMAQVSAEEQAAARMDNFRGVMEILGSVVEGVQIAIGDFFLPILTDLAKKFTELATVYGPAVTAYFKTLSEQIVALINFVILLVEDGDALNDWLSNMDPALKAVVVGITGLVVGVQMAADLIANSIGQYVQWKDVLIVLGAAIASVVIPAILGMMAAMAPAIAVFALAVGAVAAVRIAWESDFLGIQTTVTAAVDAIKAAFEPLTTAISEFGGQALTEIWSFVTGNAIGFAAVGLIWEAAKTAASNLFTAIVGYVTTNLPVWQAQLLLWGQAAWQWIVDATLNAASAMAGWVISIVGLVIASWPAWQSALIVWGQTAWQWIVDATTNAASAMAGWVVATVGAVAAAWPEWKAQLLLWGQSAWQWIVDATLNAVSAMAGWVVATIGAVAVAWPVWKAALTLWATAAWQWIVDATAQVGTKLSEWYTALKTEIDNKLPAWKSTLLAWATAAWQWIVDAAGQVGAKITEWYTSLKTAVDAKLIAFKSALVPFARAAWQWILDSATSLGAKINEWYTSLKAAIDAKLPTWKLAFMEWRIATTQWLVDSVALLPAKIAAWYTGLTTSISAKLPSFKTEMLKFATALVEWIGSSAADALPKLGAWFGRIVAWIPLAVLGLGLAAAKLAGALIGWIAGGEGGEGGGGETAVSKVDPEMEKLKAAIVTALETIGKAFVEAGKAFVTEFAKTLSEHVDFNKVGQDILNAVRTGWESVRDAFYLGVTLFINRVKKLFDPEEWKAVGVEVLTKIKEGWESIESTFLLVVSGLIRDIKKKFTDSILAFQQIGKDIIDGVLTGLKANGQAVIDYITGLISDALGSVTSLLGIESPSKVMAAIGKNMILGLINGMESMKSQLRNSVGRLVSGLVSTLAGNMLAGPRNMLAEFGKLSADFMSAAGEWADAVQSLTGDGTDDNPATAALEMLGAQQGITDNLQRQLKLIDLLRAAGRDPAQFLGAGGALGRNADPVMMMNLLTEAAAAFNDQLEIQLRIAAKGYDTLINDLRKERQEIAEIEDLALRPTLRGVDFIRAQIDDLDSQIAKAEQNLLNTGQAVYAEQLRQLHTMRQMRAAELSDYIKLWHQVEQTVEQAASFADKLTNERGAEAARRFVDNHIRPLMDMIQTPGATMDQRKVWLSMINERMTLLVGYERSLRILTTLQERFDAITSDSNFGATIAKNIQPFLDVLYDTMLTGADRNKLFNTLSAYQTRIAGLLSTFNRLGTHSVFGNLGDLLTPYLNKLLDVNLAEADRNRITAEFNRINQRLQTAQALDQATVSLQDRLDLLNKIKALSAEMGSDSVLKYIIGDVDLMKGLSPEQFAGIYQRYSEQAVAAASKALREALLPDLTKEFNKAVGELRSFDQIMKEFDQTPLSDIERAQQYLAFYDAELARLKELAAKGNQSAVDQAKHTKAARDQTIAWIRTYMDALVKADKHIARIQQTTDERAADIAEAFREKLIDPLRELMEKNISGDYRASLVTQIGQRVDQLNSYLRQIARLAGLQKDISKIVGFNPLLARFAEMRLDPLLDAIYDINTAEAERNRLVGIYRQEQEKLLRLQEKMAQLEFLRMQLDFLNEMRQLAEKFPELVNLKEIFAGFKLGLNLGLDDIAVLFDRGINAWLRTINKELEIGSPSKVFKRIGQQMMAGLGVGIQSSIMQPIGMLRSAISDIPYAMQGRSLAINMGGVTINNGMDDVMFEARVRQIVRNEFN